MVVDPRTFEYFCVLRPDQEVSGMYSVSGKVRYVTDLTDLKFNLFFGIRVGFCRVACFLFEEGYNCVRTLLYAFPFQEKKQTKKNTYASKPKRD